MDPTVEAALIGASAALIGVGGTVVVAVTSSRTTRQIGQATIDAQFADRYSRAVEQLGSDNVDVRIGGIYSLESIAVGSEQYQPTVMEVLAAFVRGHSRISSNGDKPRRWPSAITARHRKMPPGSGTPGHKLPDVQVALTVIGRRKAKQGSKDPHVDLHGSDLTNADLMSADLTRAFLTGADLTGADLTHARLAGAYLNDATLTSAGLFRANLSGAALNDADLTRAYLVAADLRRATLTDAAFTDADLRDADLTDADLTDADLRGGANFSGADLRGARWPNDVEVPAGWKLDAEGCLTREPNR